MKRGQPEPAELNEIGRLFCDKIDPLQGRETRSAAQSYRLTIAARRRSKLEAIGSPPGDGELLSTAELARLLNVNPKTVGRWAAEGGLPSFRTLGGHRRYRWADAKRWLNRADAAIP